MHVWPIFMMLVLSVESLIPLGRKKCIDHVNRCHQGVLYCWHPKVVVNHGWKEEYVPDVSVATCNCDFVRGVVVFVVSFLALQNHTKQIIHRQKKPPTNPVHIPPAKPVPCTPTGNKPTSQPVSKPSGTKGVVPGPKIGVVNSAYEPFLHSIDPSINPCNDFYEYSCGRWMREHPISYRDSARTFMGEIIAENQEVLGKILKDLKPKTNEERELKRFYDLCHDEPELRIVGSSSLIDDIKNLGGWSMIGAIGGIPLDPKRLIWEKLINGLLDLYGVKTFLDVSIQHEKIVDKVHVLPLNLPAGMMFADMTDNKLVEMYRDFLRELVAVFAVDAQSLRSSKEMSDDLEKIITFESKLTKNFLKNKGANYEDADLNTLPDKFKAYIKTAIKEQKTLDFFNSNPTIRVLNSKILTEQLQIIEKQFTDDPEVLSNYIILRYLASMAPYLDRRYVDIVNVSIRYKTEIESFMEKLRAHYIETWPKVSWMTDDDKKEAVKKLKNMKLTFTTTKTRTQIDDIVDFDKKNFVQFVGALQRLRLTEDFRAVARREAPELYAPYRENTAVYVMNQNKVELCSSIDSQPKYRKWWSKQTTTKYAGVVQCVTDELDKAEVKELPGTFLSSVSVMPDQLPSLLGIQIGYEAFKKNVGKSDAPLLGYPFSGDQNYFISFAMVGFIDLKRLIESFRGIAQTLTNNL
ncbi:Membrane metallo-endopeptidase-like 1 isoform X3 [Aphelenchoides besseyi]|nr:Membrane metallo-endopeptidase-like 1 isoform X3 [Aphelenchoides besseyi]